MENKNNVGIINLIKNRPLSIFVILLIIVIVILGIYSNFFKGKKSVKVDDTNETNVLNSIDVRKKINNIINANNFIYSKDGRWSF